MSSKMCDSTTLWCDLILEELWRCGLRHICLAPGSRSAPLALALERHGRFAVHTHYDERGLGFLALGLAREGNTPVAIITTSGTAVANLSPALHEARESGVRLLVLSADRPPELLGCGANQTLVQPGIFGEAVARTFALPAPGYALPLRWLLNVIDEAMAIVRNPDQSVVHINIALREPLYGNVGGDCAGADKNEQWLAPIADWQDSDQPLCLWTYTEPTTPAPPVINDDEISDARIVVIAGQLREDERTAVLALVEQSGWLLIADAQSGLHGHPQALACADLSVLWPAVSEQLQKTEKVLQFGRRLLSKSVNQWLIAWQKESNGEHWYIDERRDRHDPNFTVTRRISAGIDVFCRQLQAQDVSGDRAWSTAVLMMGQEIAGLLVQKKLSGEQQPVTEIDAVRQLRSELEEHGGCQVFLGNSMPIRYFDTLTTANTTMMPIWANRGISGIDGLLATACGHSAISSSRTVMLIGDLSLLHDLNSLALVARYKLLVVLLNNSGGSIFNLFPVAQPTLSNRFRIDHTWQAEGVAQMFGLDYRQPTTKDEYTVVLQQILKSDQGAIIELLLPSNKATDCYAALKQLVRELAVQEFGSREAGRAEYN